MASLPSIVARKATGQDPTRRGLGRRVIRGLGRRVIREDQPVEQVLDGEVAPADDGGHVRNHLRATEQRLGQRQDQVGADHHHDQAVHQPDSCCREQRKHEPADQQPEDRAVHGAGDQLNQHAEQG